MPAKLKSPFDLFYEDVKGGKTKLKREESIEIIHTLIKQGAITRDPLNPPESLSVIQTTQLLKSGLKTFFDSADALTRHKFVKSVQQKEKTVPVNKTFIQEPEEYKQQPVVQLPQIPETHGMNQQVQSTTQNILGKVQQESQQHDKVLSKMGMLNMKFIKEALSADELLRTNLFAPVRNMAAQKTVPEDAIIEYFTDHLEVLSRNTNPKVRSNFEKLSRSLHKQNMQQSSSSKNLKGIDGTKQEQTTLMGDTGVQMQQPAQPVQGIPTIADRNVEPSDLEKYESQVEHTLKTSKSSQVKSKAQEILQEIRSAKSSAKQAQMQLEEAKVPISQFDSNTAVPQINKQIAAPQIEPKPFSLAGAIQTQAAQSFMQYLSSSRKLQDLQSQKLEEVALDEDSIFENYEYIMGSESGRSAKTDKTIKAYAELALKELDQQDNQRQQKPSDAVLLPPINKETHYPEDNKSRQFGQRYKNRPKPDVSEQLDYPATTSDRFNQGKQLREVFNPLQIPRGANQLTISLYDYFNYMGRSADFISKIAGELGSGKLEQYAKQTTVFKGTVQKKEAEEFKITAGSAFKIRTVC